MHQESSIHQPHKQHDHPHLHPSLNQTTSIQLGQVKLRRFGFTDEGRAGSGKYTLSLVRQIKDLQMWMYWLVWSFDSLWVVLLQN